MSSTSQFSPGEIPSIIVAWLVLSFALSYNTIIGLINGVQGANIGFIFAALIATATGFIIHEMGHKFVAIRYGYVAHFRVWVWGLVLTLVTAVASSGNFLFGAPGAVYIAPAMASGYYYGYSGYASPGRYDPGRENMIISAAGPGINLIFAVGFLALYFSLAANTFLSVVAAFGAALNIGLGSFNMLPIPPLDGSKIFRKNILIALAIAGPLWFMFVYFFFINPIVITT
jgi:Zn-dependent protease